MRRNSVKLSLLVVFVFLFVMSTQVIALDTEIGETLIYLVGDREHVRTQETNLGNLVCDIIRHFTGADVAVYNGGGIRAPADMGPLTIENAMDIMAFENSVVTIELTGADIIAALERGVNYYPEAGGAFLQVSGLRYYFYANRPVGERIAKVYVGGEPIDENATYTLATNDFLAAGGDDYTMFVDKPQVATHEWNDQQMFIRYVQENSPIFPKVEGRIVVLYE